MDKKKILAALLIAALIIGFVFNFLSKDTDIEEPEISNQVIEEPIENDEDELKIDAGEIKVDEIDEEEHTVDYVEKVEYIAEKDERDFKYDSYELVNDFDGMLTQAADKIINKSFESKEEGKFLTEVLDNLDVAILLQEGIEEDYAGDSDELPKEHYPRSSELERHFNLITDPVIYLRTFSNLNSIDQMLVCHNWKSEIIHPFQMKILYSAELDKTSEFYQYTNKLTNARYTYTVFSYEKYPDDLYGVFMVHRDLPEYQSFIELTTRVDEFYVPLGEEFNPCRLDAGKIDEQFKSIMKPAF